MALTLANGQNWSDAQIKDWFAPGRSAQEIEKQAAAMGLNADQIASAVNTNTGGNWNADNVRNYLYHNLGDGYQFDSMNGPLRAQSFEEQQAWKPFAFGAPTYNALIAARDAAGPAPNLKTPDAFNFQADPGYAFRQQQGQQAIDRASAARGGFFSGRVGKELADFNSGLASQEYGNAYNRYLQGNTDARATNNQQYGQWTDQVNRGLGIATQGLNAGNNLENTLYTRGLNADQTNWDRLSQVSGQGLTASGATANANQNNASQGSGTYSNLGTANASGAINTANSINGGINNALAWYTMNSNPWVTNTRGTP